MAVKPLSGSSLANAALNAAVGGGPPTWLLRPDGTVIGGALGKDAALIGRRLWDMVGDADPTTAARIRAAVAAAATGQAGDVALPAPPGRGAAAQLAITPIGDAAGRVDSLVATLRTADGVGAHAQATESERFTRRVLNNLFTFVGVLDLDGTLIEANNAPLEAAGITAADVIGRKFWDCSWWNYADAVRQQLIDAYERARGGETVRYDVPVRMAGDTRVWIDFQIAPLADDDGRITHLIPSAIDLTSRRQAEAALRRSERRFRGTFENAAVGIAHVAPDGRWLRVNDRLCAITGYRAEELLVRSFQEITHPDDLDADLAQVGKLLDGSIDSYDLDKRYLHKDGRPVWVHLTVGCVREADGKVEYFISVIEDISERKRAEERLQSSYRTYFNLIQNNPFGVYLVDSRLRLAEVSAGAQKIFANVDPLLGRDFAEVLTTLWPEPFASEAIARFRHTLATGEPFRAASTTERRRDIDAVESYDWKIERVTLPDGTHGVVCYFYDLSEIKRYEHQIHLLMGEVNHRSKNLLAVVQSIARQTARDSQPEAFARQFMQRLQGLSASQDLLIEGGWTAVGLADLVHSQLRHLGDLQDARVVIDGAPVLIRPSAAQGIGMALHELATNAIKYGALSGDSGHVVIGWAKDGSGGFRIAWREQGGPAVRAPQRRGFGRTVIERMAAHAVGGAVDLRYDPDGLRWTLTAPEANILYVRR